MIVYLHFRLETILKLLQSVVVSLKWCAW